MAINKTWDPETQKFSVTGDHVVYTGAATGYVTLADGSAVDVTPDFIEGETPERALAISDAIGRKFEDEGHPQHTDGEPFVHTPSSVSHTASGKPSPAFAKAVHDAVPAGKDSSPAGVLRSLSKKG